MKGTQYLTVQAPRKPGESWVKMSVQMHHKYQVVKNTGYQKGGIVLVVLLAPVDLTLSYIILYAEWLSLCRCFLHP